MSQPRRDSSQPALVSTVRLLVIILVVCANVAIGAQGARAQPGTVDYIDFHDLSIGDHRIYHYHSVTFLDNAVSSHPMSIVTVPGTSQKAIQLPANVWNSTCGEFPCSTMHIAFDEPQSTLTLSVVPPVPGYVTVLNPSGSTPPTLDRSACGGGTPPPLVGLTVIAPAYIITYVDLYYAYCDAPQIQVNNPQSPIIMTGLTYTQPLNPLPQNTTPPTITITAPQPGQVITTEFVGQVLAELEVTVTVGHLSALYALTATVNGQGPFTIPYVPTGSSQPLTYGGGLQLDQSNGLQSGSNTVVVTAEDFEQHLASAFVTFTVQSPPPLMAGAYVAVAGYSVTQTIDNGSQRLWDDLPAVSTNPTSGWVVDAPSDWLVQGEETLVRVFATLVGASNSPSRPVTNVPAQATVFPAGCMYTSCALAVAMPPMTGPTPHQFNPGGITVSPFGSIYQDASDLNTSWDFVLQPGWTNQDLTVYVTINNGQYGAQWQLPPQPAVPEQCDNSADRQCQNAQRLVLHLHFKPTATIRVAPVLVTADGSYVCNKGPNKGQTFTVHNLTPTQAQIDEIFRMLNILYPVNIVQGPPLSLSIPPNLSSSTAPFSYESPEDIRNCPAGSCQA